MNYKSSYEKRWAAFCTVWWFASGDEIMETSDKQDLLTVMYDWWLRLEDR